MVLAGDDGGADCDDGRGRRRGILAAVGHRDKAELVAMAGAVRRQDRRAGIGVDRDVLAGRYAGLRSANRRQCEIDRRVARDRRMGVGAGNGDKATHIGFGVRVRDERGGITTVYIVARGNVHVREGVYCRRHRRIGRGGDRDRLVAGEIDIGVSLADTGDTVGRDIGVRVDEGRRVGGDIEDTIGRESRTGADRDGVVELALHLGSDAGAFDQTARR